MPLPLYAVLRESEVAGAKQVMTLKAAIAGKQVRLDLRRLL